MCLLFVKTVVVIIKSTEVSLNTLEKCIAIASREKRGGGGGNPLYRRFRCVRRPIFFGLKEGINFDQFGLGVFLKEPTSSSLGDTTISLWVLGQPGTFRNGTVLYSFVSYVIKAYQHCL